MRRPDGFILLCCLVVLSLVCGCKTGQKGGPIRAPGATAEVGHFVGTALSGPRTSVPPNLGESDVWRVTARVLAVTTMPRQGFERIGPKARLVIAYRGAAPVAASTRLTSGVGILVPEGDAPVDDRLGDPKTRQSLGDFVGGVAPQTTASFNVSLKDIPQPTRQQLPLRTRAAVQISRADTPGEYMLAVVGDDLIADAAPADDKKKPTDLPPPTTLSREMAVVSRTISADRDRVVLAVPFTFLDSNAVGVIFEITVDAKAGGAARAEALAALQAGAKTSAESAARSIATQPAGTPQQVLIQTALQQLAKGSESPRGTLNYVAAQSGASLTGELALVADERMLGLLVQQVVKAVGDSTGPGGQLRPPAEIALALERASADVLISVRNSATDSLSGAVLGTLDSYAGEVGHQPDSLLAVIRQSSSVGDLATRLVAENFIFLEDPSPPARVRAYDWLAARGHDLRGYDPLARGRDRRAAVDEIRARLAQGQGGRSPTTASTQETSEQ
ncbi:MAG TPA: hypothetical protein VF624_02805 [Tepidisphaeraceae bacterium]|jgi:hypothetical protein